MKKIKNIKLKILTILLVITFVIFIYLKFTSAIIYGIPDESYTQTFNNFNISTQNNWTFEKEYFVQVIPVDNQGNLIEIINLNISINKNINYTCGDIIKYLNGTFERSFIIPKQNITSFNIDVNSDYKHQQKLINISESKSQILKFDNNKDYFINIINLINNNIYKLSFIIIIIIILIMMSKLISKK